MFFLKKNGKFLSRFLHTPGDLGNGIVAPQFDLEGQQRFDLDKEQWVFSTLFGQ
jgi:hypothetical protein